MKLNVVLGLVAGLSFTNTFGAEAFGGDDADLHAAIAASLAEGHGTRHGMDAEIEAALAASLAESHGTGREMDAEIEAALAASLDMSHAASTAVKPQLSARQMATWFADATAAAGSNNLDLINHTIFRLQGLETAYDLTATQAAELTDNVTRLVAVVADLESKAALGAGRVEERSAARRAVASGSVVHRATAASTATTVRAATTSGVALRTVGGAGSVPTAATVSGATAAPSIVAPGKSFAELKAMFERR